MQVLAAKLTEATQQKLNAALDMPAALLNRSSDPHLRPSYAW
jgi:hypothetical protein